MSISSLDDSQSSGIVGQVQSIQGSSDGGLLRSASSAQAHPHTNAHTGNSHARSTSLGGFIASSMRRQDRPPINDPDDLGAQEADTPPVSRSPAPQGEAVRAPSTTGPDKGTPAAQAAPAQAAAAVQPALVILLKPHITSPTADEFLLVTGTSPLDPGIGVFVNLDGDPTRPTLEFARYPHQVVVDGASADLSASSSRLPATEEEEGYVLASMTRDFPDGVRHGLEIQRWDVNNGEDEPVKFWLDANARGSESSSLPLGLRSLLGANEAEFREAAERLCLQRFSPVSHASPPEAPGSPLRHADSRTTLSMERFYQERDLLERELDSSDEEQPLRDNWEAARDAEERTIAAGLAKTTSRLAVWAGNTIWWAVRNPLILRLEAGLDADALGKKVCPRNCRGETAVIRRPQLDPRPGCEVGARVHDV